MLAVPPPWPTHASARRCCSSSPSTPAARWRWSSRRRCCWTPSARIAAAICSGTGAGGEGAGAQAARREALAACQAGRSAESHACRSSAVRARIVYISATFLILFAAYNSFQGYASTLFGASLGDKLLVALYVPVLCVVLLSPSIIDMIGSLRMTMVLGRHAALRWRPPPLLRGDGAHAPPSAARRAAWPLCCTCCRSSSSRRGSASRSPLSSPPSAAWAQPSCGSRRHAERAAAAWDAASVHRGGLASRSHLRQGVYMIECSEEDDRGRNAGLFWSIFQLSNILGPLATMFVFDNTSRTVLFAMFTGARRGAAPAAAMAAGRAPKLGRTRAGAQGWRPLRR